MTLSVYSWEDVHRYFPQKVVEQYRKQIIEEWKSGKFKDREIRERYGMSESAFYDLIKRDLKEEDLKDKHSKPKNPSHKLEQEEIQTILDKAHEDRENIKALQSAFENDMRNDGILSKRSGGILTNQPTLIQMSNTFYPYQFCKGWQLKTLTDSISDIVKNTYP